jgi:hypothetical protein
MILGFVEDSDGKRGVLVSFGLRYLVFLETCICTKIANIIRVVEK